MTASGEFLPDANFLVRLQWTHWQLSRAGGPRRPLARACGQSLQTGASHDC
jgi:hypothetical protein